MQADPHRSRAWVAGIVAAAAVLVAVEMRPKDTAPDADVHQPARAGVPAPVLAECQLRNC